MTGYSIHIDDFCSDYSLKDIAESSPSFRASEIGKLARRIMLQEDIDRVLIAHSAKEGERLAEFLKGQDAVFIQGSCSFRTYCTEEFLVALAERAMALGNTSEHLGRHWNFSIGSVRSIWLCKSWDYCIRQAVAKMEAKRKAEEKKRKQEELVNAIGSEWTTPQRVFIPGIGTVLRLEEDWTFKLHEERRCNALLNVIGAETVGWYSRTDRPAVHEVTLKKGALLKVSRVYIRRGTSGSGRERSEFSSLTFGIQGKSVLVYNGKEYPMRGGSFWSKLSDINKMVASVQVASMAIN